MMMMSSGGAGEDQGRPAVGVDVAVRARSSCKECVIPIHIYICVFAIHICVCIRRRSGSCKECVIAIHMRERERDCSFL